MKLLKVAISATALALAIVPALAQAPSTLRIGLQEDPDRDHRLAIQPARLVIVLCSQLDPGDILQA